MAELAQYTYRSTEEGWSHPYLREPVLRALEGVGGPILDMGCGNGAMARALLNEGFDVYGMDASVSGIAQANTLHPGRFHVFDVEAGVLPEALRSIDFKAVLSTEVIEHLYNPRALVALAATVLRAGGGGRFVISTPYHGYLKNLAIALSGKSDAHFTALWDGGHIKFFSRRTLSQLLAEGGFRPASFIGAGRFPYLWKSMVIAAEIGP